MKSLVIYDVLGHGDTQFFAINCMKQAVRSVAFFGYTLGLSTGVLTNNRKIVVIDGIMAMLAALMSVMNI